MGKEVNSKINMLRSYFLAEVEKTATNSGDGREDLCESKWLHFKSLIFIEDNVTSRRRISSLVSLFVIKICLAMEHFHLY